MTEKQSKPETKTKKPDIIETVTLSDISAAGTGTPDNPDLPDDEIRNTTGG